MATLPKESDEAERFWQLYRAFIHSGKLGTPIHGFCKRSSIAR